MNANYYDRQGNPILYFPARPVMPDIHDTDGYVAPSSSALYDARHNIHQFRHPDDPSGDNTQSLIRLRVMLGDSNYNGVIDDDECVTNGDVIETCQVDEGDLAREGAAR